MVNKFAYNSLLFNLKIRQTSKITVIDMQLNIASVNTCDFPGTLTFIENHCPSVLRTQCFNDKNLPFALEVTQTEIGHLFEHLLIDELCVLKIKRGAKCASFRGTTSWNWQKNRYGSFQIWIDIGSNDLNLLIAGLKKAVRVTGNLIESHSLEILTPLLNQKNLRATV